MNDARSPRDDETREETRGEKAEESGGTASRTAGHDHDSAETRGDSEHPYREDR